MRNATTPIGVIGGSGLYKLFDGPTTTVDVDTPYGATSSPITMGRFGEQDVAFLTRHGATHTVPPHRINYRANVWALKSLGVHALLSFSAVGGLHSGCSTGTFVITDQLIDRTHGRADTFFDGQLAGVHHLSAAEPFCGHLRQRAASALSTLDEDFLSRGTVVVIQGPRFSTTAESRWFRAIGGDTINMTQYPEVTLAAELNMGTVNLSFVTDSDAGDHTTGTPPVEGALVLERIARAQPRIQAAIAAVVSSIGSDYQPTPRLPCEAVTAIMSQKVS